MNQKVFNALMTIIVVIMLILIGATLNNAKAQCISQDTLHTTVNYNPNVMEVDTMFLGIMDISTVTVSENKYIYLYFNSLYELNEWFNNNRCALYCEKRIEIITNKSK